MQVFCPNNCLSNERKSWPSNVFKKSLHEPTGIIPKLTLGYWIIPFNTSNEVPSPPQAKTLIAVSLFSSQIFLAKTIASFGLVVSNISNSLSAFKYKFKWFINYRGSFCSVKNERSR